MLSTRSAFSLATLVVESTFKGAPEPTSRLRAGPAPWFSSVVSDWARFLAPRIKGCPFVAKAMEAAPNKRASITARPTRNTVALPTHITLLAALLNILRSLSLALLWWGGVQSKHTAPCNVTVG